MPEQIPSLDELADMWLAAKGVEVGAIERRRELEESILEHPDVVDKLVDEGTTTVGRVKVSTGFTRAWDQQQLDTLSSDVNEEFWPFKDEWKEDRRASRVIEERFPDLWAQIRNALTIKPRKPTISVTESKD